MDIWNQQEEEEHACRAPEFQVWGGATDPHRSCTFMEGGYGWGKPQASEMASAQGFWEKGPPEETRARARHQVEEHASVGG